MSREVRIGIFVGAAFLILAAFIFIVGDMAVLFRQPGTTVNVTFDTAAGLDRRAAVKMAGVLIGYVKDIRLDRRKARVVLMIYAGQEIPKDSRATLNTLGLLGEKYVEILPGEAAEACPDGGTLQGVAAVSFDQIGTLLASLGEEVKTAAGALREALDQETRTGVRSALAGVSGAAEELQKFLGENRAVVLRVANGATRTFETADKTLAEAAEGLDRTLALLRETIEERSEGLRSNLEKIRDLAGRVEESVDLLNASLEKISRGEGTLGRLVEDPGLYEEAQAAVRGVEATTRRLGSIKPSLDVQAGYFGRSEILRSAVFGGLWLTPRSLLEAGLVHDPRDRAFRFSLQAGIRVGNFVPRVGFIESEFGAGADYRGPGDRWRLTVEGFDWNRAESPRFRIAARILPFPFVYLTAGADDFTLARRREFFFGAGVVLR